MTPSHQDIVVWKVLVSTCRDDQPYYFSVLSEAEQKRSQAFVTRELTSKYVISQGILRCILANYLGVDAKHIDYTFGPRRKPYLAQNAQQLQFNMSHSHDAILIGISFDHEVGVDVEMCDPKIVAKHLEDSVFSERELKQYKETPEHAKAHAFTCAWTHKEALLKLAGVGLYKDMKEVEVPLSLVSETSAVRYEEAERYIRSFVLEGVYIGAVASTKADFEISIQEFHR